MPSVLVPAFLAMLFAFSCGFFIPLQASEGDATKLVGVHVASILRFFSFVLLWAISMMPWLDIPAREELARVMSNAVFLAVTSHLLYFVLGWNVWRVTMGIFDVVIFVCWARLMTKVQMNPARGSHLAAMRSPVQ